MSESVPELSDDQPEIQSGDHGGQTPSQDANPDCIDKFSHDGGVAREMNQRHDGKAKLHAQDHLAQQEEPGGGSLAGDGDHDHGGDDGE